MQDFDKKCKAFNWITPDLGGRSDLGQGIAEYVIILAVIVVTGIVLVTAFGGQLTGVWNSVTTQFGALA